VITLFLLKNKTSFHPLRTKGFLPRYHLDSPQNGALGPDKHPVDAVTGAPVPVYFPRTGFFGIPPDDFDQALPRRLPAQGLLLCRVSGGLLLLEQAYG